MRILITNDDGIHALGLCALYDALAEDHEVHVVAPESERSAVGHAITLSDPLRVRPVKRQGVRFGWAVSGTPADCVKLALHELVPHPLDLILSGINQGANVGINVLYSGTVSAATEGAILGVRSAAVSLDACRDPDFCCAAAFAWDLVSWLGTAEIPAGVAINVNVPSLPAHRIRGVKVTRQGTARFAEQFEKRVDPRGNIYYWQAGETLVGPEARDVDCVALKEGYITVTPIHFDLTAYRAFSLLTPPDF